MGIRLLFRGALSVVWHILCSCLAGKEAVQANAAIPDQSMVVWGRGQDIIEITIVFAKIVQFQIVGTIVYVLDAEGSMWKNTVPETSKNWTPMPGPTRAQHRMEDEAIWNRERIDISEHTKLPK